MSKVLIIIVAYVRQKCMTFLIFCLKMLAESRLLKLQIMLQRLRLKGLWPSRCKLRSVRRQKSVASLLPSVLQNAVFNGNVQISFHGSTELKSRNINVEECRKKRRVIIDSDSDYSQ